MSEVLPDAFDASTSTPRRPAGERPSSEAFDAVDVIRTKRDRGELTDGRSTG
jgi:hypothetical protein